MGPTSPITFDQIAMFAAVATTAVLVVVWLFSMFQTKKNATAVANSLRSHIMKVEGEVDMMRADLSKIGSDVSYIRGRIEPKN